MAAGTLNLYIEQGATFDLTVTLHQTDITSPVVNLTGHTARMQIRTTIVSAQVEIELLSSTAGAVPGTVAKIVMGDAAGTMRIFIPATLTAAFTTWNAGVYDLEVVRTADGVVDRKLQGSVAVSLEVTR